MLASQTMSLLTLVSFLSFCLIVSVHSENDVVSLTITMDEGHYEIFGIWSGCTDGAIFQLYFNHTIYETSRVRIPGDASHTFSIDAQGAYQLFNRGSSECIDPSPRLIIENPNPPCVDPITPDSITFSQLQLTTQDGTFYGANGFCIDQQQYIVSQDYGPFFENYFVDDTVCGLPSESKHYDKFCVDSEIDIDCGPFRQIIYFDENRPNEMISNARWESGLDFDMNTNVSCSSTSASTNSPTANDPSKSKTPTIDPTVAPSRGMCL